MKKHYVALFQLLLWAVILSPYISSWLPLVAGKPIGPALRLVVFVAVMILYAINLRKAPYRDVKYLSAIYLLIVFLTLASFVQSESTAFQYLIGGASFIFYPATFAFATLLLNHRDVGENVKIFMSFDRFFVRFFMASAAIGAVDVFMDGNLVKLFGYNPNYGGEEFSLITTYNDVTRANAGISDALAFGYLMSLAVIYFFNRSLRIKSHANYIGVAICTLACFLSLTRGAIVAVVLTYAVYLLTPRRLVLLLFVAPLSAYIISVSPYSDLLLGRFTDSDEGSETSTLLRLEMAVNSVDFLTENPMGIGIGTQGAGNILSDTDARLNTDNYFFHIFLELGLYYGGMFIIFLIMQFRYAFKRIRSYKAIVAYIMLFLISSMLSSSIAYATLGVMFWLTLYIISLENRLLYED